MCVEVADSLGKIGNTQAVEPLMVALESKSERVRRHAAAALGKLGDRRALPELTWLQQNDKEVAIYRDIAGEAIQKILNKGQEDKTA